MAKAKSGFKINPKHKGWCTPMTKSTCTGKRRQFAINAKHHFKKQGEDGLELDPIDLSNAPKWLKNYKDPGLNLVPGFDTDNELAPVTVNDRRPPRLDAQIAPIEHQYPTVQSSMNRGPGIQLATNTTPQSDDKKFDWGWLNSDNLLTGLSAIDALLPGRKNKRQYLRPEDQRWDNPNPYGTGSSALMDYGGNISPEKAKEMLKNPPHGKKLTSKQKKLFQAVAHGWKPDAANGIDVGPDKPSATKVTTVPKDYKFDGEQNGRKYYKKTSQIAMQDAISYKGKASGSEYESFLQERLKNGVSPEELVAKKYIAQANIDGYRQYYKPAQDYIYTEEQQQQDKPAFAFQGEPIYEGNKLKGLIKYNSRASKGEADGGTLNTGYQDVQFMYVDDAGKPVQSKGIYNIPYQDWNKEFGPTRHIHDSNFIEKYANNVTHLKHGGDIAGSGLAVEGGQYSKISPSFTQFKGPSHANGGIDINYGGHNVEVEGDETAAQTGNDTLTIFGNMTVPGTSMKFKTAGKKLAEQETKALKQAHKGGDLLEESDPHNRFERLAYNAGALKTKGAEQKLSTVHQQKEFLAGIQQSMLDVAAEHNLDPEAMSEGKKKKAKYGAHLKAEGGKSIPSDAIERAANKYGIPASVLKKIILQESGYNTSAVSNKGAKGIMQFMPATAKSLGLSESQLTSNKPEDVEANIDAGARYLSQLRKQNNGDLTLAIAAYNGGQKSVDFVKNSVGRKNISGQDFVDFYSNRRESNPTDKVNAWQNQTLDYVNNIMDINPRETDAQVQQRLGGFRQQYYSPSSSPISSPEPISFPEPPSWLKTYQDNPISPSTTNNPTTGVHPAYNWDFSVQDTNPPSNITKLGLADYGPELYSIATNRPSFVPAQKFTPQLFDPYQVSFQDRINENNQTFNALESTLYDNPAALSSLSAQTYGANNAVRGEEFRTNQGINNEITNKNVALMNEAQMQNLQILDNQYVRQEQARANTRRDTQITLNSLASKVLQHDYENKTLAAYENLSNYRMVDTNNDGIPDKTQYFGPDYQPPELNASGVNYNANNSQEIQYRNYPESQVKYDEFGIPKTSTYQDRYRPITRGYKKKKAGGNMLKKFNDQYGRK